MSETKVTQFQQRVYMALQRVPAGRVTTYKSLAKAIGCSSSQAIGQALHVNPFAPQIPCHRVVHSSGHLGGYAGGADKKIELLRNEGVGVLDGAIENFRAAYFDVPRAE